MSVHVQVWEMPTGTENVRIRGKTGTDLAAVKTAPMTLSRPQQR